MIQQIELSVTPDNINNSSKIKLLASSRLNVDINCINSVKMLKRSIDARKKEPFYHLLIDVYINETPQDPIQTAYRQADESKKIIIIGSGPAGLFAALQCLELGIKPIIFERGKDVQSRRKDLRDLHQEHIVNPDSNYCFGEGGAGTYSDGKLYTRASKRGDVNKILKVLYENGASEDILVDSHPHIGSNILPKVIKSIREKIIAYGGEIYFEHKLTDIVIKNNKLKSVIINDSLEVITSSLILATGHSARDVYYMLNKNNVHIEEKPFALGVRIEHPQELINQIQYHSKNFNKNLPPASYTLKADIGGRGVYSFCMCPGGIIIPAATNAEEIVVNGMSLSRRDSPYANSGFVVTVNEQDWKEFEDQKPFGGLKLQQKIEQLCFDLANRTQCAPAQRVTDFYEGRESNTLNNTSYIAGLTSSRLDTELPNFVVDSLKAALKVFDKKMHGYYTSEAQIAAPESRTSSPIKIPREKESFMHIEIEGIFPAGEGAGYAGGIVSAAIDGENCAKAACKVFYNV